MGDILSARASLPLVWKFQALAHGRGAIFPVSDRPADWNKC